MVVHSDESTDLKMGTSSPKLDSTWTQHLCDTSPDTTSHIVICPSCTKKLRWPHPYPGKAKCSSCGVKLAILIDQLKRSCSAQSWTERSKYELAANWLDYDRLGKDDKLSRYMDSLPDDWLDEIIGDHNR
ncbi:MAG: hypothetical protein ACYTBZ_13860 [Planctomycetota bacterium]|jgi:hypothetical protein